MTRTLLLALLLLAAPLTGCAQLLGPADDAAYTIAWDQPPQDRAAGASIQMSWTVDGPDSQIPHTAVHWANESVEDPESPADYGNTTGAQEPATIPGTFDTEVTLDEAGTYHFVAHAIADEEHIWAEEVQVTISDDDETVDTTVRVTLDDHTEQAPPDGDLTFEWSLEGAPDEADETTVYWGPESREEPTPGGYTNHSPTIEDAAVPGSYNATLNVSEEGTYHARAYALNAGSHHWSEEVTFEITTEPQEHEVDIQTIATGYDPDEIDVRPGDTITWTNTDEISHTVTFEDEDALGDSGSIGPGDTYNITIPEDLDPGTYEYYCDFHTTMPTAEITVLEPG